MFRRTWMAIWSRVRPTTAAVIAQAERRSSDP
jgi:hypothetical protein